MKIKYKILIIMSVLTFLTFSSALTYSFFHSSASLNASDKNIAKFIFNTNLQDSIELPLIDLKPGFHESYNFSVTNGNETKKSDVNIEYKLIIKTFHLVPLTIKLYSINDKQEELILTCDNSFTRNENKEILCNSEKNGLLKTGDKKQVDNYKIDVEFPSTYTDLKYANLVDYIDIDVNSWQKIKAGA